MMTCLRRQLRRFSGGCIVEQERPSKLLILLDYAIIQRCHLRGYTECATWTCKLVAFKETSVLVPPCLHCTAHTGEAKQFVRSKKRLQKLASPDGDSTKAAQQPAR